MTQTTITAAQRAKCMYAISLAKNYSKARIAKIAEVFEDDSERKAILTAHWENNLCELADAETALNAVFDTYRREAL